MKVSGEQSSFVCTACLNHPISLFYSTYPGIEHSVSLHLLSPDCPRLREGACLRAAADDDGEDDHSDQEHLGQHRQTDEQDVEYPLLQH